MSIEGHSIHGLFVLNRSDGTGVLCWKEDGGWSERVSSVVCVDVRCDESV